ncbi:MAG: tetratricopeptide repeat protein [Treponema sp.]|nr:tetratricopeptide repeat protein [Treponema sp.]
MADNIVKIKGSAAEKKNLSGEQKLGEFLGKNFKVLVGVLCAVIAAIVAYVVWFNVSNSIVRKNLDKIEVVEYSFTKDASFIDDSELSSRQEKALSNLTPYLNKGGIVGARANMLAADIYGQKKDWQACKDAWLKAASKRKGTYIESLCNFNAAAAYEELGQSQEALALYEKVSADKNFVDRSRAYFNAARLKEAAGDYEGAKVFYKAIGELGYSNDSWNDLAKTRLIDLENQGKIK